MAFLEMHGLEKFYGASHVVKSFDLAVEKGEFISFLGPSGCGKTTTLRMIAGFETPSAGTIAIGGRDVVRLRPNGRNIGMVFQAYALFPNMTVAQNVGFGLKIARMPRRALAAKVEEMLQLVGLPGFGARYPFQLSGGQQQRVALARALAPEPQVLLLDEPLSALDAKIRVSLREEIRRIQRDLGITTIYVTHDQEEALSMSDRIVVMHEGVAEQTGTPFEIYNHPTTRFVAGFVGTLSTLTARVLDPASGRVTVAGQELVLGRPLDAAPGATLPLSLRPESVALGARDGNDAELSGLVEEVAFLGAVIRVRVRVGDERLSIDTFNDTRTAPPRPGEAQVVSFATHNAVI